MFAVESLFCLVCNDEFDVRIVFPFVLSGDFYSVLNLVRGMMCWRCLRLCWL